MSFYNYYQRQPNWGTSKYQFGPPPAPVFQPQRGWSGSDFYRAQAGLGSGGRRAGMFDQVWQGGGSGDGLSLSDAKLWHRQIYGGLTPLEQHSPLQLGAAAAYEALRHWQVNNNVYSQPIGQDSGRQMEALAGIAAGEASRLTTTMGLGRSFMQEAIETSVATARRIFTEQGMDGSLQTATAGIYGRGVDQFRPRRRRASFSFGDDVDGAGLAGVGAGVGGVDFIGRRRGDRRSFGGEMAGRLGPPEADGDVEVEGRRGRRRGVFRRGLEKAERALRADDAYGAGSEGFDDEIQRPLTAQITGPRNPVPQPPPAMTPSPLLSSQRTRPPTIESMQRAQAQAIQIAPQPPQMAAPQAQPAQYALANPQQGYQGGGTAIRVVAAPGGMQYGYGQPQTQVGHSGQGQAGYGQLAGYPQTGQVGQMGGYGVMMGGGGGVGYRPRAVSAARYASPYVR